MHLHPAAVAGDELLAHDHLTIIEPPRGWRALDLKELWVYRELLWVLASRDVRVRYRQTLLGAGWAVLRPLLTMVIFSVIFGRLAGLPSEGVPYPIFVFSALVPWTFFASAVTAAGSSLLGSSHLITKVYFPRLLVPLSSVGATFVDLLISTLVLIVMMLVYGVGLGWNLLAAPLLLVILAALAIGFGILVAALSVSYRDLQQLLPFVVQLWMFATPVIYPVSLFPARWRWVLYLNPVTGVVEGFRGAFLGKQFDYWLLGLSGLTGFLVLAAAVAVFERFERRFADLI